MTHSERDETLAAQVRYLRVQQLIESLLQDVTLDEVAELFRNSLAAAKYQRKHEGT